MTTKKNGRRGIARIASLTPEEKAARIVVGKHIRRVRYERGLSQRALAAKVKGFNQSGLSSFESGLQLSALSFMTLKSIAHHLDDRDLYIAINALKRAGAYKVRDRATNPEDWQASFAEIVRAYRLQSSMSAAEMARRLKCAPAYYRFCESGRSRKRARRGHAVAPSRMLRGAAKILGILEECDQRVKKNNHIAIQRALGDTFIEHTAARYGKLLGRCRVRLHLSQDDLAQQSGYGCAVVHHIEYGKGAHLSRFSMGCILTVLGIENRMVRIRLFHIYNLKEKAK